MGYFILVIIAVVLVSVDFFYLNLIQDYFNHQIKMVQGSPIQINYIGAVWCYLFLVFGIYYFIIKPQKNVMDAFLLGIVIYGVYETTNLALMKNWTIWTAIIDTLWGGILFAMTTYIVKYFVPHINRLNLF